MKQEVFNAIPESERWNRVLEGRFFYACVHRPNTSGVKKFNAPPEFSVNLVLDKANQAKAESFGLKVRPADDRIPGPHVKIVKKIRGTKTADQVKPEVVDSMQQPIPASILIGNDSEGLVKFGTTWHPNGGGGISTHLSKVQVLKLVEFKPDPTDRYLVKDDSGFVVGETNSDSEFDE